MITQLIKVGNSRGVRIPKPLIQETGLTDDVTIRVEGGSIVISPVRAVRSGWQEAFNKMHANNDDVLIDKNIRSNWDDEEWEWK
jgi:antitoxin MazE